LTEEYLSDVEPPSANRVMNLELSEQSDTISIYTLTRINYSFNADGLKIHLIKFSLGSQGWNMTGSAGTIEIDPRYYQEGYYKLNVEIYTNTGTGSIGDILGYEGYYATHVWTIRVIKSSSDLILSANKTDNGFLKLEWEKYDQPNFVSYVLRLPDSEEITITDPDKNFFIDTTYVCGWALYEVTCNVYGGPDYSSSDQLVINEYIDDIYFTAKDLDSLTIFWNRLKYNCLYTLEMGQEIHENTSDTSITIPHPGFTESSVSLHIKTVNGGSTACFLYKDLDLFEKLGVPGIWKNKFTYNLIEDVVYAYASETITSYDKLNNKISNISLDPVTHSYYSYLSSQSNSSKIAALFKDRVFIFADSQLKSPLEIPVDQDFNYLKYTDNDKIIIGKQGRGNLGEWYINKAVIIDLETMGETIQEFDYDGRIRSSKDGKFMAFLSYDTIYMYEIQDDSIILKYSFNHLILPYTTVFEFNDYDPTTFFINRHSDNILEMRSCEDNSVISQIDYGLPTDIYHLKINNVDPVSGYLFITVNESVYKVLDMQNGLVKYIIGTKQYLNANLFNNKIFTTDMNVVCIEKYLD
jgi:hypothetical protein